VCEIVGFCSFLKVGVHFVEEDDFRPLAVVSAGLADFGEVKVFVPEFEVFHKFLGFVFGADDG